MRLTRSARDLPREAGEDPAEPAAFEVLDALAGAFSLVRRSATLDGSVPLRVAHACLPLLEGNAFGFQVALSAPLTAERSLGRWAVRATNATEAWTQRARAALPVLQRRGLLGDADVTRLGSTWPADPRPRRALALWTGLLVRPRQDVRLRLSSTANRRPRSFTVREALLAGDALLPLVLELDPDRSHLTLGGELATLAALPREALPLVRLGLGDAEALTRAHAAFYDAAYFATKRRGDVARTYRSLVRQARGEDARASATAQASQDASQPAVEQAVEQASQRCVTVVDAGPRAIEAGGPDRRAPDRLVVHNAVPFAVSFDGLHVEVSPEARALQRFQEAVARAWAPVRDHLGEGLHEGAVLYFSKYFTPHPPGEPHFFVKPPALVQTPPGTSLLIEGRRAAGHDVMRGVVQADRFHAVPAVFQLAQLGEVLEVAAGEPLMELFAVPRALERAGFTTLRADLLP